MSVESIGRALNLTDEALTTSERFVLVAMANHDGDGGCWPAIATLARYTGLSERQIQRCITALEAAGYVTRHIGEGGTQHTRNDRRPTRYTLHLRGDTHVAPSPNGVTSTTQRGDTHDANGVTPTSPEPSYEPSLEPSAAAAADDSTRAPLTPPAAAAVEIFVRHRTTAARPANPDRYARHVRTAETRSHAAELAAIPADADPVTAATAIFDISFGEALIAHQKEATA